MEVFKEAVGTANVKVFLRERNVDADSYERVAVSTAGELTLAILEFAGAVSHEKIDPV